MTLLVIQVAFEVDDTLANVTSAVLSDPTGTFGVKRNDTDAVVVADSVALTNSATGVYTHSFTAPAAGLTYTYHVEFVRSGVTYRFEGTLVDTLVDAGTIVSGVAVSEPDVMLFVDVIDHLADVCGGVAQERNSRVLKRSLQMGLDEICNQRDWACFNRWGRITTAAPYSTGTISYDHTGGTSERLVTLTSGSFPTWAARGKILIDDVAYDVESYLSTTTLTLTANHNPGADVAALTTYTLYQNEYPLPAGFRSMLMPYGTTFGCYEYVSPETILRLERLSISAGTPRRLAVVGSRELPGAFIALVDPYPDAAETLDFFYQSFPRRVRRTGYETSSSVGTVTISANSRVVTGSSTTFNANMVGAVLRLTTSTTTAVTGNDGTNTYDEQYTIESVASATSLTLVNPVRIAYSGAKYMVSDPVQLDRTLFNVFLLACQYHMAINTRDDAAPKLFSAYKQALTQALEWDSKVSENADYPTGLGWEVDLSS